MHLVGLMLLRIVTCTCLSMSEFFTTELVDGDLNKYISDTRLI